MALSDPAVWGPLIVAFSVNWGAGKITEAIQSAERARHEDHEFLTREIAEISAEISQISLLVDGISSTIDPPPSRFEDPPY